MIRHKIGRTLTLGAALLSASGIIIAATPGIASATQADCKSSGSACLTVVGSNTTQEVMDAILGDFNVTNGNGTGAQATNVYAQPVNPVTAPSDVNCPTFGGPAVDQVYATTPVGGQRQAPNGSGAGKTALKNSVTNNDSCVSIARSSSPPSTATDPAGTQAWAYAVDAVSWVANGTNAPTNLSETQLQQVYGCQNDSLGNPVTNWNQVGGLNKAIKRYYPQTGSGSGSFFASILGFDPRVLDGVNNKCTTAAVQIEENEATSVLAADKPGAIMIYSTGAFIAQANKIDLPDNRNGFGVRKINGFAYTTGSAPNIKLSTTTVKEANTLPDSTGAFRVGDNTAVQGVRNLFNFINTNSVDFTAASGAVATGSRLCLGDDSAAIKTFGFAALPLSGGSTCLLITRP